MTIFILQATQKQRQRFRKTWKVTWFICKQLCVPLRRSRKVLLFWICHGLWKELQDQHHNNYTTTNYFKNQQITGAPVKFATSQPNVFLQKGPSGSLNGSEVDVESNLLISTIYAYFWWQGWSWFLISHIYELSLWISVFKVNLYF